MKIAIVDDEEKEQNIIKKYICEWATMQSEHVEFSCYNSSESFLFEWEDNREFSLLVLDIEMGEMNGLDLAKRIRKDHEDIPILFVTGYDEYMQYGYDVSALHYLLKPLNKDKFFQVLNKLSESKKEDDEIFMLNTEAGIGRIKLSQIMYVEAAGHNSILHTKQGSVKLKEAFGTMEKQLLPCTGMIKCHRAYLVNLRYVSAMQSNTIVLDNYEMIPVSRTQVKQVQKEYLRYYKENSGLDEKMGKA